MAIAEKQSIIAGYAVKRTFKKRVPSVGTS